MKSIIKKLLPAFILSWYHKLLALLAMLIYGFPSNKLIVIGITGTNGKSTVTNIVGRIFEEAGHKIGWTSTANFKIADIEWLNDKKMTMLGRFKTQKFLKQLVKTGCKYAVIETSSEGIKQYRHLGINYDIAVFTNLTPEHIESHGSFDKYKKAKGQLFKHLTKRSKKKIDGNVIDKTIIVNADSEHADYFLSFPADKKITYSIKNASDYQAVDIEIRSNGSIFTVNNASFKSNLYGHVNIYNELAAIAIAQTQNIDKETIKHALIKFKGIPGRFEFIEQGPASADSASVATSAKEATSAGKQNFKIMVDYAPEPESMNQLYQTIKVFNFNHIIHVLGSCGGGRDVARRPVLGKLSAGHAHYVIVTNEDPYDDDPQEIIDQVAAGALSSGKILNDNLFKILDRREAIKKALSLAKENAKSSEADRRRINLVLITGKGCEQAMCVAGGKKIPWDDREVVRELMNK